MPEQFYAGRRARLLAGHAAEAELARLAVGSARGGALCGLHMLQVLHGAAHAEGGAVEVVLAQREGEEELVVRHQLAAPLWQVPPAHRQDILRATEQPLSDCSRMCDAPRL